MRRRPDRDPSLALLRALSLFSACSDQELRRVSRLATVLNIEPGCVLVDPPRWERQVFVIAEGIAEVRHDSTVLDCLGPGAVFGEVGPRPTPEPRAVVSAATPMIVFVLTELEWRALPGHVRLAADRVRVETTRLPCDVIDIVTSQDDVVTHERSA
jgi:hypothetical protein